MTPSKQPRDQIPASEPVEGNGSTDQPASRSPAPTVYAVVEDANLPEFLRAIGRGNHLTDAQEGKLQ